MFFHTLKILSVFIVLILSGCSTARFADLPPSYQDIEFDKLASENHEENPHLWTFKGGDLYYFNIPTKEGKNLVDAIINALERMRYSILSIDQEKHYVWGRRGMRMNEWGSIFGVYYRQKEDIIDIYVQSRITQDFTGGWKEHRSKKLSIQILKELSKINKEI